MRATVPLTTAPTSISAIAPTPFSRPGRFPGGQPVCGSGTNPSTREDGVPTWNDGRSLVEDAVLASPDGPRSPSAATQRRRRGAAAPRIALDGGSDTAGER